MLSFADRTDQQQLDEKLIVINKGARYGQIVFLAGGAGSGKGFAFDNFMESDKFKVRDIDNFKTAFIKLDQITKKFPEIRGLDLSNPNDVFQLHAFVKDRDIKDKSLDLLLSDVRADVLPNITFDITLKDSRDLSEVLPRLRKVGYQMENIHLAWVLTNYTTAVKQNRSRPRIVPDDILLKTHQGAARTMFDILSENTPIGINGAIYIILGGSEHSVFATHPVTGEQLSGKDGKALVIKDFVYLTMKEPGEGIKKEKDIQNQMLTWIRNAIPRTKKLVDIFPAGTQVSNDDDVVVVDTDSQG